MTQLSVRAAPSWLKIATQIGLLGGLVAISIALQGMIQAFSVRDVISNLITMSQAAILLTFFAMGYLAVTRIPTSQPTHILGAGAIAGFISSALLVFLIWLGNLVNLGNVFVNATPQLYELLTFKLGLLTGSLFLLAAGLVLGALAAAISMLTARVRRAIITALISVVALGVLQDLIRVTFTDWEFLTPVLRFFYESNGLSLVGAIILFVLVMTIPYLWNTQGARIQSQINRLSPPTRRALRWSSMGLGVVILFLLPSLLGLYLSEVLDNVGLYLLMFSRTSFRSRAFGIITMLAPLAMAKFIPATIP